MLATNQAMRVGVDLVPADMPTRFGRYPGCTLARVFGPPGAGIPAWGGARLAAAPTGITPHVSFKDWPDDDTASAAVVSHLNKLPEGRTEWLTYNHEPEGDLDPAEYRRRWGVLAGVVHAHPARPRVTLVPIQTLQWTDNPSKGAGDWSIWWAGVGDAVGWDCYADSWRDAYPAVGQFLATPLLAAAAIGLPLVVPELGAIRMPSDKTGDGRANWIRTVASALKVHGAAAVSWWDATGTGGRDFRLDDSPSYNAWRDVLAGRV
jgi:hypothetical protein